MTLCTPSTHKGNGAKATGNGKMSKNFLNSSSVNVSQDAKSYNKAMEIAKSPTTVDEAKVEYFQKLIDQGRYSVGADKVANSLVDEHMLLPSS